eukprot:3602317-Prorocentrum_lima.AAC.1
MTANCELYRRFVCRVRQYPWALVQLADDRVPEAERRMAAQRFLRVPSCCCWPGLARRILADATAETDLMNDTWMRRWRLIARLLTLQCADVEWRHGRDRNKARHQGQNTMSQLAARSVCAEALVIRRACCELQ